MTFDTTCLQNGIIPFVILPAIVGSFGVLNIGKNGTIGRQMAFKVYQWYHW